MTSPEIIYFPHNEIPPKKQGNSIPTILLRCSMCSVILMKTSCHSKSRDQRTKKSLKVTMISPLPKSRILTPKSCDENPQHVKYGSPFSPRKYFFVLQSIFWLLAIDEVELFLNSSWCSSVIENYRHCWKEHAIICKSTNF